MLIIFTDEQILAPQQVCQSCLLADATGAPRWRQGKLCCGHVSRRNPVPSEPLLEHQSNADSLHSIQDYPAKLYECKMGFRVAHIRS